MTNPVDLGQGDRLAGEDKHRMNPKSPVELAVEALKPFAKLAERVNAARWNANTTYALNTRMGDLVTAQTALAALQPLPVRQEERERIALAEIIREAMDCSPGSLHAQDRMVDAFVEDILAILSASPTPVLMERGEGGSASADLSSAKRADHDGERSAGLAELPSYWRAVIGDKYSPAVLRNVKHMHPATVKEVFDKHVGTEVADVIAGLIFKYQLAENRAEFFISEYQKATARPAGTALSGAQRSEQALSATDENHD